MATRVRAPIVELDLLHEASTSPLVELLVEWQVAHLRGRADEAAAAEARLGLMLTNVMRAADLFGRRRILLEFDARSRTDQARRGAEAAWGYQAKALTREVCHRAVPRIAFVDAVQDLLRREPRLAPGWRATQEVYTQGGFAAARASTQRIAGRIQEVLVEVQRSGTPAWQAEKLIVKALKSGTQQAELEGIDPAGFTRAYAETVFRTNVTTSYTRGRREQAQDPDIRRVMGGFRYVAVPDGDARKNHMAADGLIAATDDPIWQTLSPPLGYQCRCALEMVTNAELRAMGILDADNQVLRQASAPAGARPDPGFTPGGGVLPAG